jgi:hypothetical protein
VVPTIQLTYVVTIPNTLRKRQHIRQQNVKTIVLSCHSCLTNTGVEKKDHNFNVDQSFDHQISE